MKERKPIFYDSEKVRWRRTRRILEVSGGLLTLLLIYFFLTIAGSVELPAALLPDTRPIYHSIKKKQLKPVVQREGRHKRVANIGQVPAKYDPLRAAFFVSWDPNSLASLKKHYKDIDLLMPEQLHAVAAERPRHVPQRVARMNKTNQFLFGKAMTADAEAGSELRYQCRAARLSRGVAKARIK